MTTVNARGRTFEVPPEVLAIPAVEGFTRVLTSTGELTAEQANRFTRRVVGSLLIQIGEWYARVMSGKVEAVLRLREDLATRYVEAMRAVRAGAPEGLGERLSAEAFDKLFNELLRYVDEIATASEWSGRKGETLREEFVPDFTDVVEDPALRVGEPPTVPETPPSALFDDPAAPSHPTRSRRGQGAEEAYDRELSRILRRLDPPASARGGAPASPVRAVAEDFKAFLMDRFLRAGGVPRASVRRQPSSGGHLAADIALSHLDPVRDLGYEIRLELPPELRTGGRTEVAPDGYSFTGNEFEFLEHKAPQSAAEPGGHYAGEQGQLALLADLALRGRLAAQIPGCRGWRYSSGAGWLSDTVDWTIHRLQGRPVGEPPVGATEALINAVNTLAADPATPTWARLLRVAP